LTKVRSASDLDFSLSESNLKSTTARKDIENPLRLALAEAIEKHEAANVRADLAHGASGNFWRVRSEARDAVEAAEAGLALAQGDCRCLDRVTMSSTAEFASPVAVPRT
jgi:hypothetical protein